jgi:transglutaminase-like putative cysteine protease
MFYSVVHQTSYSYSNPVALCHNEARLLPRNTFWQKCQQSEIRIIPNPAILEKRHDFFGNQVVYFAVQDIHKQLEVQVETKIEVNKRPFSESSPSLEWQETVQQLNQDLDPVIIEARHFALPSPFVKPSDRLREYAHESFLPGRSILAATMDLTQRIYKEFTFDPHFTTVATPLTEVFENRRGVCQDFAHLAIGCLRSLGLAARYVSGYLETIPPPGKQRLVGADASHAWLAVYLPGIGWAEFDPTNNCMPGERHITVAWGRDYGDVAPLKGVMSGGGSHRLKVAVDVMPIAT